MIFYLVRDKIRQNYFCIFWEEWKKHQPPPNMAPHKCENNTFKTNIKYIKKSKDRKSGTRGRCDGTKNPRVIQKPDNLLTGIHNRIPWKPYNPLKGIRIVVKKRKPGSVVKRVNHIYLDIHKPV